MWHRHIAAAQSFGQRAQEVGSLSMAGVGAEDLTIAGFSLADKARLLILQASLQDRDNVARHGDTLMSQAGGTGFQPAEYRPVGNRTHPLQHLPSYSLPARRKIT